ncbi:AraC family transcriptional regulator [Paenibacillus ferrarius]|uniref:AraC family transcriptional regulator n=1 Tax=Paenibacillus ferrarius TaxID=1469647 RepID=A0A1V4HC96_9BACL|nr:MULTISPECIES: AraC family transcriptional regulator [Paenibacillus]NQX71112.1 helix-turn-helix domain-containing protein [Paenibacillus alba]OPH49621.1 AraC family transcriptional regulator [Paenibacillus ferrarius]
MNSDHTYFTISINPQHSNSELSVLFGGEGKPVPLHKNGPAVYDYYLIHTVLSGEGTFEMQNRTYRCAAGDSFIIYPGELFSYVADADQPWHYTWVAFTGRAAGMLLSHIGVSLQHAVIYGSNSRVIRHHYRRIRSCFRQSDHPALEDLESAGWLRLLLRELGQTNSHRLSVKPVTETEIDRQIGQAIRYLELQYTQSVSIEELARNLGYHRTYLCKMFKQSTGLAPMQYLFKIRMERAKQLLETSMTIDQVASSVGFNDALYFSKQFRKWTGAAPSVYRKELKA